MTVGIDSISSILGAKITPSLSANRSAIFYSNARGTADTGLHLSTCSPARSLCPQLERDFLVVIVFVVFVVFVVVVFFFNDAATLLRFRLTLLRAARTFLFFVVVFVSLRQRETLKHVTRVVRVLGVLVFEEKDERAVSTLFDNGVDQVLQVFELDNASPEMFLSLIFWLPKTGQANEVAFGLVTA
jgi:Ca2+/Na+ antiporter